MVAWGARADRRRLAGPRRAAYSAPFLVYVAYMAWKVGYYGDLLPNTYYAKSANLSWFAQGGVYALSFYSGGGRLALVRRRCRPDVPTREYRPRDTDRFVGFAVLSFVAYNVYVAKVGGDFMFARFYISLVPLLALGRGVRSILSTLEDGRLRTAAANRGGGGGRAVSPCGPTTAFTSGPRSGFGPSGRSTRS